MRHPCKSGLRAGLALGLAATLAACAGGPSFWHEDGASSPTLKLARAKEQCTAVSRDYDFATLEDVSAWTRPGSVGNRSASARRQADLHRLCMNERGYRKGVAEDGSETVE